MWQASVAVTPGIRMNLGTLAQFIEASPALSWPALQPVLLPLLGDLTTSIPPGFVVMVSSVRKALQRTYTYVHVCYIIIHVHGILHSAVLFYKLQVF